MSPSEDIPEWAEEEQTAGVASLGQCCNGRSPFRAHVESVGDLEQDRLHVVQVCNSKCGCLDTVNQCVSDTTQEQDLRRRKEGSRPG